MTYKQWLATGSLTLKGAGIESARLDVQLLLERAVGIERAYLLAHLDTELQTSQLHTLNSWLERRAKHEPIAYILGTKEFYGRDFMVTPDVLIPRPESESFLKLLPEFGPLSGKHLLDVGTGSGALAISAVLENTKLQVWASDVSEAALEVARANAKKLGAHVRFVESNLLSAVQEDFDIIVANLPYVPPDYEVSPDVHFEPQIALYADHGGLALIEELLRQTPGKLLPGGAVLIECLEAQQKDVIAAAKRASLHLHSKDGLILAFTY